MLCAAQLMAQATGSPPLFTLSEADIYADFGLPALRDTPGSPAELAAAQTQVFQRAQALGLTSQSALDAWNGAQLLLSSLAQPSSNIGVWTEYSGTTASGLNRLITTGAEAIRVTSSALSVDQPIEIVRSGVTLDLRISSISAANPAPYMLRVENAVNVTVSGGNFVAGDSAILVNNCRRVRIQGAIITNLTGAGIVVTGSQSVFVQQNRISGLELAAITIHRGTVSSYVAHNEITGDVGASNMTAGILLTDREVDLAANPANIFGPDGYWVINQPMGQRRNPPRDNLVAFNHIAVNSANGIYSDGGVRNIIFANSIQGNAKEGICLDNGSTANVIASNILLQNGRRWGESDAIMAEDFISGGGRLPDGTPAEKVPGISIDNALYNIVFMNNVAHNFGGGVKIVRTGYFNAIGMNTIYSDNDGASATEHFFGIELGAADGDARSDELDFTPSHGNIVFSNVVRGSHYSGIFFDPGSDQNDVVGNTIEDATAWALESSQQMSNNSVDNLTHLPSRNIGSGLDPALIQSGQAVDDDPPSNSSQGPSNKRRSLLQ